MCQRAHHHLFRVDSGSAASDFATPAAGAHYAPDLVLEPEHLALDVAFDLAARSVRGTASTTVRARSAGGRVLVLDAVSLAIESVSCDRPITHTYDGKALTITFAEPVSVGERRTVTVRYAVKDPITGLVFSDAPAFIASDHETQRARYWIPCVDHPAVRTTLEVAVTGPSDWHLLGPGVLVGETTSGTEKTARFELAQRCPAYLLCVALGDFARLDGGTHVDPSGNEVPIAFFCAAGEGGKLERTFGPTKEMMDWMVAKLGRPFPFPKYDQLSVPRIGGAMENISLTSWDDFALLDERGALDRRLRIDTVNVHEMAHSYFGDSVVIKDYAHAWLKESWASYMESVWIEDAISLDEATFYRSEEIRDYRAEADERYQRPIVTRHFDSAWDMFDMHLYPGGAARLHMLRKKVGDAAFWAGVRDYLTTFDGGTAETADFVRALEKHSGLSLQRFFDEWILSPGYPKVKASFAWDAEKKTATVTLEETQKNGEENVGDEAKTKKIGLFELPMVVAFELADGTWERRTVTLTDRATATLACDEKPLAIVLDPDGDLVFSLTFDPGVPMLERALAAPTVTGRIQAARALGAQADAAAVDALRARFSREPIWGVRVELARALGEAGTKRAAEALAELLGVEKDHRVRAHLARAAGNYRDPNVEAALVAFLARDDVKRGGEGAHAAALEALGKQRGDAHLDTLREHTLDYPCWGFVQRGACAGLAETRSEGAEEILEAALDPGQRRPVRMAAAEALGALGKWLSPPGRARALDRLVDLGRDPDYGTRLAASRALAALGAHEAAAAFDAIERMAAAQDHPRIRRAARAARGGDTGGGPTEKLTKRVEELEERLRKLERSSEKLEGPSLPGADPSSLKD
jgi:aminopeptidase N